LNRKINKFNNQQTKIKAMGSSVAAIAALLNSSDSEHNVSTKTSIILSAVLGPIAVIVLICIFIYYYKLFKRARHEAVVKQAQKAAQDEQDLNSSV
jgi:uncharacterized membrane protein YukC